MIEDRLRTLVRHLGAAKLAGVTPIERRRWQTVATNLEVKPRIEDLQELLKAFPEYEMWLLHGECKPDAGQVMPGYEEAISKLSNRNAG
jgi:hypothetical protein